MNTIERIAHQLASVASKSECNVGLSELFAARREVLEVFMADDVEDYMERFELPTCKHYFDPTKVHDGRECGLHTAA